jgi:hypothetical protein
MLKKYRLLPKNGAECKTQACPQYVCGQQTQDQAYAPHYHTEIVSVPADLDNGTNQIDNLTGTYSISCKACNSSRSACNSLISPTQLIYSSSRPSKSSAV